MKMTFKNGDKIPALGLGTWLSKKGEVYDAVRFAIKIGYRHIDCAAIYGNEEEIGQALADALSEGDVTREELWITSKLWNDAHRRKDVQPAINKTLKDLQLTYLDLYLVHWPVVFKRGVRYPESGDDFESLSTVPLEETWSGMEDIQRAGLVRHVGVSNFSVKKLKNMLQRCSIRPEVNQVEMHPYLQQRELLSFCTSEDIFLTGYSPLGRPTADPGESVTPLIQNDAVLKIAEECGCSPANVVLAWGIQRGTIVIPKSVSQKRLKENLSTLEFNLTSNQMEEINRLDCHHRFVDGTFWTNNNTIYTLANLWDE